MNTLPQHDCEENTIEQTEHTSTPEKPYHYVGSGLSNVYLVGVKYWVCRTCDKQAAEIPSLNQLLGSIARILIEKNCALTGEQARFLRKRLGKPSKFFAALIGISPERYCAVEAGDTLHESQDKLVRFIYRALSRDQKLKDALSNTQEIEQWLLDLHQRGNAERIVGTWLGAKKRCWRVEAAPLAA